MRFWHLLTLFVVFVLVVIHRMNQPTPTASDVMLVGPDKIIKTFDSISNVRHDGQTVFMVRFNDSIRVDSVRYFRILRTYKIK